jgi:hypothetical protein
MPLQATSGAASYDAFGGGVPVVPQYIEEVFSCFLFTGTGSAQTITNNIDLSTNGGLVWIKPRIADTSNTLYDTARGINKQLSSESDGAESTTTGTLTAFNTNGFSIGTSENASTNGSNNASWTFRKQPKFFDVVTWTGSGANRTIAHNLGSVPACIIVKRRNTFINWQVYHRSLANTEYLVLNDTAAKATGTTRWNSTTPTSTVFSLGTDSSVNASGDTYVAYLFAHDAGGFGLTGTDNVISCGSFTTDASGNATVSLGYEPQWTLQKRTDAAGNWFISDVMRGMTVSAAANLLRPNLSDAESTGGTITPTATGFTVSGYGNGLSIIYIAIRRGPMKVPTVGTSVFAPIARTGTGATAIVTTGFAPDLVTIQGRGGDAAFWFDRLRGFTKRLRSDGTSAETSPTDEMLSMNNTNFVLGTDTSGSVNYSTLTYANWAFRRAPSFFDEVCWIGDGINGRSITHNLNVEPELIIAKQRSVSGDWIVYAKNNGVAQNAQAILNGNKSFGWYGGIFPSPYASSTTFQVASNSVINGSGTTYVAYLFATCAGVSKVGTYTGNGSSQTINCGFTGGARFVLIKRTDSTGDWMVSDSARGIVSGNDPYLELNNTNSEVTGEDWLDTDSTGFVVNEVSGSNANTSSATYIFLAIA